ncbi:MAG TPA: DNA-formamidopyrimidine glycosylase family protein [Myxococcota bacterium]|nr:DNA-formamidopyrimidine glycosylase family protein [Myxococcota bacterium]
MPELPDIVVYLDALAERVLHQPLTRLQIYSPFLLRSVDVPAAGVAGKRVMRLARAGKRIVFGLEGDVFIVLHLMIAGRLHWKPAPKAPSRGRDLAHFFFPAGTLTLTEASKKKRAALYLVRGESALAAFDRGGVQPLDATLTAFAAALRRENHTLKRALTDPRLVDGLGNAYSDEILHRARLSPFLLTSRLSDADCETLYAASRAVLTEWIARLRAARSGDFPVKVTAFREEMAVHGRFRKPCPVCATPVQRIVYAENETNYCPACQTGGKLLADRALSRLLKDDWPRTLEEIENLPGRLLR